MNGKLSKQKTNNNKKKGKVVQCRQQKLKKELKTFTSHPLLLVRHSVLEILKIM